MRYVGRGDVAIRLARHANDPVKRAYDLLPIANNNLTYAEARGLEELLIRRYGGPPRHGGTQLLNDYQGIPHTHPRLDEFLAAGRPLLREALRIIGGP